MKLNNLLCVVHITVDYLRYLLISLVISYCNDLYLWIRVYTHLHMYVDLGRKVQTKIKV